MRRADVVEAAGLREGEGLRLTLLQYAGVPAALLECRRRVRGITDIGEGHRGPCLDPGAARPIGVLDVVVADLDRVDPGRYRPGRPGKALRHRRRPQRA